ncbi:hypothetical protein Patl1_04470 [Pistacia atlantica]|uniref:Uncharacterized protein n=1 Tax=Pistacia atlantica TaxID=434234 RepID=A0ACC1BQ00_9ROSI|nr:hypothetical protein Patl1_04470 [Pistacia atlantica]
MATLYTPSLLTLKSLLSPRPQLTLGLRPNSLSLNLPTRFRSRSILTVKAGPTDSDYSSKRSSSNEPRETIMLPGCDYNHWLIVMEFPKDPAPTREQMIETYLNTLATVLGSFLCCDFYFFVGMRKCLFVEEHGRSKEEYVCFQHHHLHWIPVHCILKKPPEKFKGLPGVLWVLPDSYIDVKNKDYGGDKYVNGEIIPCTYPTYQPKQRKESKYVSKRYERRRDGPPPEQRRPRQAAAQSESTSG